MAVALELQLPARSEAPKRARMAIADLPGIDAVRDDAVLVVSELVSEAVSQSASDAPDALTLCAHTAGDTLTITVRSSKHPAAAADRDLRSREGEGLRLQVVRRLARECGCHENADRLIWAQLDLRSPSPRLPTNVPDA